MNNDHLSQVQREQLRILQSGFEDMYNDMRPSFNALFQAKSKVRPPLHDLIQHFKRDGGVMWAYGEVLYSKPAVTTPDEETIRSFYAACPPFRALTIALCVAQYERCIRDIRSGDSLRAGRVDTYMATYLPYCEVS
jgi:hypothetical protein